MEAWVNPGRGVGRGICVLYAAEAFVLSDEDGCATARSRKVPVDQEAAVRRAAEACPEQAIQIAE